MCVYVYMCEIQTTKKETVINSESADLRFFDYKNVNSSRHATCIGHVCMDVAMQWCICVHPCAWNHRITWAKISGNNAASWSSSLGHSNSRHSKRHPCCFQKKLLAVSGAWKFATSPRGFARAYVYAVEICTNLCIDADHTLINWILIVGVCVCVLHTSGLCTRKSLRWPSASVPDISIILALFNCSLLHSTGLAVLQVSTECRPGSHTHEHMHHQAYWLARDTCMPPTLCTCCESDMGTQTISYPWKDFYHGIW